MKDILSVITAYREERGWTEYQLAERSGLPQSTILLMVSKKHGSDHSISGENLHSPLALRCLNCLPRRRTCFLD